MSYKNVRVCDGCGKELTSNSQAYKLELKTDRFWNSVEMDCHVKCLDFCERCANSIKTSLGKIAYEKELAKQNGEEVNA